MSFCSVPSEATKQKLLLETIDAWESDFHLSPCERSSLLAMELYERRKNAWGEFEAHLTPKGMELVYGHDPEARARAVSREAS